MSLRATSAQVPKLTAAVRDSIGKTIERSLEPDPADRPASAQSMRLRLLEQYTTDGARKKSHQSRSSVPAILVPLLLATLILSVITWKTLPLLRQPSISADYAESLCDQAITAERRSRMQLQEFPNDTIAKIDHALSSAPDMSLLRLASAVRYYAQLRPQESSCSSQAKSMRNR